MLERYLNLKNERVYLHRMREFIEFHGRKHSSWLTGDKIGADLTHLIVDRMLVASTQNAARHWCRSEGGDRRL
jgi:hypothetical protein